VSDVLGYSPEELTGKPVEELLVDDDREKHIGLRQEYMMAPERRPMARELDLYALRKDDTSVPVEISLGPVERDGEVYVVATISDVS
jgi:PAS domain S-box-containing protein